MNPTCDNKMPLVRRAKGIPHPKIYFLEKTRSPVSGLFYSQNRVCNAVYIINSFHSNDESYDENHIHRKSISISSMDRYCHYFPTNPSIKTTFVSEVSDGRWTQITEHVSNEQGACHQDILRII